MSFTIGATTSSRLILRLSQGTTFPRILFKPQRNLSQIRHLPRNSVCRSLLIKSPLKQVALLWQSNKRFTAAFPSTAEALKMETNGVTINDRFEKLPTFAKPVHYDITLKPDLAKFTFEGWEQIILKIDETTDHLKLGAYEIEIEEASINSGDTDVKLTVTYDKKWQTADLKLPPGTRLDSHQNATLKLKFNGILNDKLAGFYRSKYTFQNGEEGYIATTQFESADARRAFPCWDEPMFKAKFDITLIVDKHLTALSNMPVVSELVDGDLKTVKFDTSPLMSSYLVAFIVGPFEYIEDKTKRGVNVRVYSLPGKTAQCHFALEKACAAIDYYEKWFAIDYPLPKVDLIAIPDFSMGAMENWGLVTYREVYLIVHPTESSFRGKQLCATIVGHELAHMWFGNLVTMKWWTDLWLKEGFATFMEYLFVGEIYPKLKTWTLFMNSEWQAGLLLDGFQNSHPVEVPINDPRELHEIYDLISYAKSASIIRMLFTYLGHQTFRDGLRLYLSKFQYGNSETVDLWNALGEASEQDIHTLMSCWTQQMGFPLVTVSQQIDGDKRKLKLSQQRFLSDGSEDKKNQMWRIPITVTTEADPDKVHFKTIMTEKQMEVVVEGVAKEHWLKVNSGCSGFYRVEYSEEMLSALLAAIQSKTLPVVDRFGLASDLFALVKAGRVSASQFLNLLKSSENEDDYTVWNALNGGLGSISHVLEHSGNVKLSDSLDAFIRKLYGSMALKFGWDVPPGEDSRTTQLRALILRRLGKANDPDTIEMARKKFSEYADQGLEINSDLRTTIFILMAKNDSVRGFEQLKKLYERGGLPEMEKACLLAMGCSKDPNVHKAYFDYAVNQGKVRSQDLHYFFIGTQLTKEGQDFCWIAFKENMEKFRDLYCGLDASLFQHILKTSCDGFCSEERACEVEKYFGDKLLPDEASVLERPIKQAVEQIRLNAFLMQRHLPDISKWLADNVQ